ncbi:MAG: DMT family transporter [Gammaproteobacteria bacterium]|nr:DMT family transporter [Gammaproteobacteria bacterium]
MQALGRNHPAVGALYIIGAALAFSTMGALVRALSGRMPGEVMVFWRSLFSLVFLLPWLLRLSLQHLGSRHLHLHVIRATSGLLSMYCLFYALGHLHIAEAMLLNQTATLFVPFIAYLWLREYVPVKVRWAIFIGFMGVVMVLHPGDGIISWPALIGLASGLAAACSVVTIRRSVRTEPPTRIVFYFSLFGTLGSAIPLIWTWQTPSHHDFPLLMLIGALATTGQLLMTRAYALAPAAQIGPFTYSSILFGALYGWFIWSEAPGVWFWSGALFIIAGGVVALRDELRRRVSRN